ncbi:MAG: bifunctional riboflavin kinase/FAD synthetase [Actinomycetota bacterium]|nr:MAG: bifunctional riboflavin kinase/FAD synthetase [Actinomycetota bacterium]
MMKIFTDANPSEYPNGSVVTIGAYDGVHLGHRYLISKTIEIAKNIGASSVVVTFDRHPASVVRPGSAPLLLSDLGQKLDCLSQTGVDSVCVVTFDQSRANESAVDFVEEFLVGKLNVKMVVVGSDFHFGHNRQGNVELLEKLGQKHGFGVIGAPLKAPRGGGGEVLSSTLIRHLIAAGDMEKAQQYLGRLYELRGRVEHGDSRGGNELGFPTANVSFSNLMATPPDGIYAGWVILENGERYIAAISLGTRPTYYPGGGERLLEAFILGFEGDIYGNGIKVLFGKKIRDQERFSTSDELKAKIAEDIDRVEVYCTSHSL